jgi:hypothetical protein
MRSKPSAMAVARSSSPFRPAFHSGSWTHMGVLDAFAREECRYAAGVQPSHRTNAFEKLDSDW